MTKQFLNPPDQLQFSQNWNRKLGCDYYTTLRLPNKKYTVGNILKMVEKGTWFYNVEIIAVHPIMLRDIDEFTAYQDTGYSVSETVKLFTGMYKQYNFNEKPIWKILCKQLKDR